MSLRRTKKHSTYLAFQPSTPDDHSPLEPPLPIPNRTVKRRHADDSTDCPCESRSLSGTHASGKARSNDRAFLLLYRLRTSRYLASNFVSSARTLFPINRV